MGSLKMPRRLLMAVVTPCPSHGSSCPFNPSIRSINCMYPFVRHETSNMEKKKKTKSRSSRTAEAPFPFPQACRGQVSQSVARRPSPPVTTHPQPPAWQKLASKNSSNTPLKNERCDLTTRKKATAAQKAANSGFILAVQKQDCLLRQGCERCFDCMEISSRPLKTVSRKRERFQRFCICSAHGLVFGKAKISRSNANGSRAGAHNAVDFVEHLFEGSYEESRKSKVIYLTFYRSKSGRVDKASDCQFSRLMLRSRNSSECAPGPPL
jgi:hypothetical protein